MTKEEPAMGTDRSVLADVLALAEVDEPTWPEGLAALWASGTPMNADDGEASGGEGDGGSEGGDESGAEGGEGESGGESDDDIAAKGKDPDKVKATLTKLRADLKKAQDAAAAKKDGSKPDDNGDVDKKVADLEKRLTETALRADLAEVATDTGVPKTILQLVGAKDRDELEQAATALKEWRGKGPSATDDLDGGAKPSPQTADDPASLAKSVSRGW